jgi:hypothetical protein
LPTISGAVNFITVEQVLVLESTEQEDEDSSKPTATSDPSLDLAVKLTVLEYEVLVPDPNLS